MKKPVFSLVLLLAICTWQCTPSSRVMMSDLNHPRYKYIFDFDSKVSQQKIRSLKGYYSRASTGVFMLDVVANAANTSPGYYYPYQNTYMPKLLKKIKIMNQGTDTLYADLNTDLPLDHEYNCSVKNIILPPKKSLKVITAAGELYALVYHWKKNSVDTASFTFNPNSYNKLRVEKDGVNRTRIVY